MAPTCLGRLRLERGTIRARRATKPSAKRAREDLVIGKPRGHRHAKDRLVARGKSRGGILEPQAQDILLRRFANDATKRAMKM